MLQFSGKCIPQAGNGPRSPPPHDPLLNTPAPCALLVCNISVYVGSGGLAPLCRCPVTLQGPELCFKCRMRAFRKFFVYSQVITWSPKNSGASGWGPDRQSTRFTQVISLLGKARQHPSLRADVSRIYRLQWRSAKLFASQRGVSPSILCGASLIHPTRVSKQQHRILKRWRAPCFRKIWP